MKIIDYIKSRDDLSNLDLLTVYTVIVALMEDGYILPEIDNVSTV